MLQYLEDFNLLMNGVDYPDYDTETSCRESGCDSGDYDDYCRCSKITNVKMDINVFAYCGVVGLAEYESSPLQYALDFLFLLRELKESDFEAVISPGW